MLWSQLVFLLLVGAAIVWDLRTKRIPKAISVPLALLGLAVGFGQPGGPTTTARLLALGVVLVIFTGFGLAGSFGGGDTKLAAAIGAWVGFGHLPLFIGTWIVCNAICAVLATLRGAGWSGSRWWQEQRVGLRGLRAGVLHRTHAYSHRAAVSIGGAGLVSAWWILHV